jgi:hypothetical protein
VKLAQRISRPFVEIQRPPGGTVIPWAIQTSLISVPEVLCRHDVDSGHSACRPQGHRFPT